MRTILPGDGAVGQGLEGGADVVEGEGAVDRDAECAVGECGEDELEPLAGLLGGDAEAAVAEQVDAPAVDRPEVDGDFCAGADPEHDVATVLSEQAERGRGEVAAEGVDDDCRPYLRGGVGEPVGVGDQCVDGAEFANGVGFGGVAGLAPHPGTESGGEADDGKSDAPAGTEDEHPVVGGDVGEADDDAVGGEPGDARARRLFQRHAVGHGNERVAGCEDVAGVDAVAGHAEPVAVDEDGGAVDVAGGLQADGARQRPVGGDGAGGDVAVDRVDPGAAQGDEHLAGSGLGESDVLDHDRIAVAVQPGCPGPLRVGRSR